MATLNFPQAYTISYKGLVEVLEDKEILFSRYIPGDKSPEEARAKKFFSIWDTGASTTCISSRVASELGLQPVGKCPTSTAGGIIDSYIYVLSLWLPNHIYIPAVTVTECNLSEGLDCLIGMDVIRAGDFCVSNFEGKTTMSFRIPSVCKTDYVALYNSMNPSIKTKVGRNEICPCGSGKKYKNCCGK